MKIINIGTDRKIFEKNSAVRERIIEYGNLFEELHVVVFSKSKLGFYPEKISSNVWIYPTNSKSKIFYIKDAFKQAVKIFKSDENKYYITAQDPFECGLTAWLISVKTHVKFQLQIHTDLFNPYFKNFSFLNKVRTKIAKFLLPKADSIRVVSKRIKDSLNFLRLKVEPVILPIFSDIKQDEFNQELKEKYSKYDFILLMASRISKEKNISFALDVFSEVLEKHSNVVLVIVGDGPELNKLKSKTEMLNINKNVFFEGWQNNLNQYFQIADAFLLTSFYEGYGLVLVESAASGCPVISSDVGLIGDVLKAEENALICSVGDKKCFIDSILRIMENKELHEKMKSNGKVAVSENFISKEKYLKLFKETFV